MDLFEICENSIYQHKDNATCSAIQRDELKKCLLCAFIYDFIHDSEIKAPALHSLFEFIEMLKHTMSLR